LTRASRVPRLTGVAMKITLSERVDRGSRDRSSSQPRQADSAFGQRDDDALHRAVGDPSALGCELRTDVVALSLRLGNTLPLGLDLDGKAALHLGLSVCAQHFDLLLAFAQSLLERRFEREPDLELAALGGNLELMDPLAVNERISLGL
jgi:hypothetical protein